MGHLNPTGTYRVLTDVHKRTIRKFIIVKLKTDFDNLYGSFTQCPQASIDLNDNDDDPFPRYDISNENK